MRAITLRDANVRPPTPIVTPLHQRIRAGTFRGVFVRRVIEPQVFRRSPVYTLEMAVTPHALQWGLSRRPSLPHRHGMLFDFGEVTRPSFWGKHTLLRLDLAFLDGEGRVLELRDIRPGNLEPVISTRPARYGLEVEYGTLANDNVRVGDELCAFEMPSA